MHKILFALEGLKQQKVKDHYLDVTIAKKLAIGDDELIKPAIDYLKSVHGKNEDYYNIISTIFSVVNDEKQVYILTTLQEDDPAPQSVYDQLSQTLPKLKNHHEVHLFFTLVEEDKKWSDTIASNAVKLLNNKKFFLIFHNKKSYIYRVTQNKVTPCQY